MGPFLVNVLLIISQQNISVGVSFLIKLQSKDLKLYIKDTSPQVFSLVFFETPSDVSWLIFCCPWLIFFDAAAGGGAAILNSC